MYLMPWNTAPNGLYCNIKSNVLDVEHKSNTPEIYESNDYLRYKLTLQRVNVV